MDSLVVKKRERVAEHLRMICMMKKMMRVMVRMALSSATKRYVMSCHAIHISECKNM